MSSPSDEKKLSITTHIISKIPYLIGKQQQQLIVR